MRAWALGTLLALAWPMVAAASDKPDFSIRGQPQDLYHYSPSGPRRGTIVFLPGDGGWRGFAIDIAQALASSGWEIYGLDTKRYLESFTGATTLSEAQVGADLRGVADFAARGGRGPVALLGWSEGAGLGAIAAALPENKAAFRSFVGIGVPPRCVLGWRWTDNVTWITKKPPNEPMFSTAPHLARIAPLPFVMIQSTNDEWTPADDAKKLFANATEPKRWIAIDSRDHKFAGNRGEFFRRLRQELEWNGN